MAINNFIPTIWSENLLKALDKQYIAAAHCNRDYEGDITQKGSVVKICGTGAINISDYTKNTDMSAPQSLSDTVKELSIDQAKYFNFQIDDIDRAQATPKLMSAAMSAAANALANESDKYIFSLQSSAASRSSYANITPDNILDTIIEARRKLYESNVTDAHEVFLEVSPGVAAIILKAKILKSTDNVEALETGCLGMVAGCKVFVSNNINKETNTAEGISLHRCMMRTRRAIAYAEQLSEIEAYRPESRFSDAVKGLHLYGASVIYPEELFVLEYAVKDKI